MPSPPASGSAAAPPPPPAYLSDVFRFVEAHSPPDYALEVTLRPFLPDLVPALGAPDPLIKPPRPDGAPDPLGLTVLDEPAPLQSDPALLTLQLRRQARLAGGGGGARGAAAEPLGVLADPATQPVRLDACIQHVEALQLDDPSAALPPGMPDLEALMQAWPPEVEAQLRAAPLPDPRQAVDTASFARVCCAVLDLSTAGAALLPALHALFALYLEFKHNPAFRQRGVFDDGADAGWGGHVPLE